MEQDPYKGNVSTVHASMHYAHDNSNEKVMLVYCNANIHYVSLDVQRIPVYRIFW